MRSVWVEVIILSGVLVALVASTPPVIPTAYLITAAIILYNRIDVVESRKGDNYVGKDG